MDYYENKVKSANSLMLANHGSRIDWMIGMYVGYIEKPVRVRVGFVCEKVIKYMPFIGWYRNVICEDVFVDRSFKIDKINISTNLNSFHESNTERMLYLSPEGVVVDFGEVSKGQNEDSAASRISTERQRKASRILTHCAALL
jgi:1-acyl-sn-glycerol-3-phosphate acyltransferase